AGLLLERRDDRWACFGQRLDVGRRTRLELDDMEAERRLDHRGLAGLEPEDRIFERLDHLAARERAEFSPAVAAAGIVGVGLGKLRKVGAVAHLLEQLFGLAPGRLALGCGRILTSRDQDMAGADLLRMREKGLLIVAV